MNNITLVGRLTHEPQLVEHRSADSGHTILRVAVDRPHGRDGSDFFNVAVWGSDGENAHKHLVKGQQVGIAGWLKTSKYTDQDGVDRTSYEVQAREVQYMAKPRSASDASE